MRVRSRLVLGFCGLAVSVPAASAAPPDGQPYAPAPAAVAPSAGGGQVIYLQQAPATQPAPGAMPAGAAAPAPGTAAHHHHGLLSRRHCVECQRAHAKAVDGVDVPPPPGYPGGAGMPVAGGTVVSGPVVISERVLAPGEVVAPGYAVVGGSPESAGYAVVNGQGAGAEPIAIGTARGAHPMPADPRIAGPMPRQGAGPYDPSVMQSSLPPPQTALPNNPGGGHSHIVKYVKGVFGVGRIHDELKERRREQHAAVAYSDPNRKVNELPASVVYGQK